MGFWIIFFIILLPFNLIAADTKPVAVKLDSIPEPLIEGVYPTYPKTTPGKTPEETAQILRGEYLTKMGDCIACHTNTRQKVPSFAGRLPINTPFGTFYSPNITPDKETGIGNWTEEDFIRALKKGRNPQGHNFFPVFPYPYFANITDADAKDLYAYFMHIPAVNLPNLPQPFPFNVPGARLSLWGWNLLFFYPTEKFEYDPNQTAEWNRGKYIVDGLGHCSMCHTPLNIFGSPKKKYYLSGAFVDGYWAPNIAESGLRAIDKHEVAGVFQRNELINSAGPVAGPMAEVNHNSLSHLTLADQLAIVTYLKSVKTDPNRDLPPPASAQNPLKRGKQVFINSCILCHQNGQMAAPIIGNSGSWYQRLKDNGSGKLYDHAIRGYNSMPIRGACVACSDDDVKAAVDYILSRSLTRSQWAEFNSRKKNKATIDGKTVYTENCAVCHDPGKLGAPRIGDTTAWRPLIAKNLDILVTNVLNTPEHPKNGGCTNCSTDEIIEAVKYIVSRSKSGGNYSLW